MAQAIPTPRRRILLTVALVIAVLLVIIAGVLAYPYVYLWGAGRFWDKAEPELHLIPAGFQGPVIIVYNDSAGAQRQWEGKSRRYDIPASGILYSQFEPNDGWGRPDYEYVDSMGHRTAITPGTPCDNSIPSDPVQACLMGRRYYANVLPSPEYQAYVVSHNGNRSEMYDRGDSLVERLLFTAAPR